MRLGHPLKRSKFLLKGKNYMLLLGFRLEEIKIEEEKPKDDKLQQSLGKSTAYDESPKMITPSTIKKRLFEEITPFTIPFDDRFNSVLMATHNDLEKDPISLKRAPLNHELLEELELLRLELKTPEVQETMG